MMKMFFTFMLASALTLSTVLGRSSGPTSRQLMYETDDQTIMESDEVAQVMAVGDRSSNLKYVMAIQSSTIWEEIKKRSLTINTSQGLDDKVGEKSPDNLTDQELAQLKQVCHDGLKCVAVDQLLVLQQVNEPLGDGIVSVRTAITKITQVITKYTTEYHEDVYQYEAVKQSDDQSKVYESVTTIVEDNKELCQIDLTPATVESQPKRGDSNTVPAAVDNNSTVNYNTIKNYNINNGTINSATINIEPHSDDSVVGNRPKHDSSTVDSSAHEATTDGPAEIESKKRFPDHRDVKADRQSQVLATIKSAPAATDGLKGKTSTKPAENDARHKRAPLNHAQGNGTSSRPVATTDDHPKYAPRSTDDLHKPKDQQLMITDGLSPRKGNVSGNGSAAHTDNLNGSRGRKSQRSRPDVTSRTNNANTDEHATNNKIVSNRSNENDASDHTVTKKTPDGANNNTIELDNSAGGAAGGENDSDSDIVSAGSHNQNYSRKGLVEDGFLNNGIMKAKSVDNSNRNKGTLKDAKANNGIINVGTTNNGPVNYGSSNDYTNNGTTSDLNSYDIRQYLDNIDKMYSAILNELAKE